MHCSQQELVQHILLDCSLFEEEREKLRFALKNAKYNFTLGNPLGRPSWKVHNHLIEYVKQTGRNRSNREFVFFRKVAVMHLQAGLPNANKAKEEEGSDTAFSQCKRNIESF